MTFSDLQSAVARLATDPRVHPTCHVAVRQAHESNIIGRDGKILNDHWLETTDLVAIAVEDHVIVLSALATEPALAR